MVENPNDNMLSSMQDFAEFLQNYKQAEQNIKDEIAPAVFPKWAIPNWSSEIGELDICVIEWVDFPIIVNGGSKGHSRTDSFLLKKSVGYWNIQADITQGGEVSFFCYRTFCKFKWFVRQALSDTIYRYGSDDNYIASRLASFIIFSQIYHHIFRKVSIILSERIKTRQDITPAFKKILEDAGRSFDIMMRLGQVKPTDGGNQSDPNSR